MPEKHDSEGHGKKEEKTPVEKTVEVVKKEATEEAKRGFFVAFNAFFHELMEILGGAAGGFFASELRFRGEHKKAERLEKAQQLYKEGKHEEARELIIVADIFGFGLADEIGLLAALAWMVQFLLRSTPEDQALIGPFLDALDGLDTDTHERLVRGMAKIESVKERGDILVSLARMPGDIKARVAQVAQIAQFKLDPANHPANVLVTEVGNAVSGAFEGYKSKVDACEAQIRHDRAERETRRQAALQRIAGEKKNRRGKIINV